MSDLISRKAAIELIHNLYPSVPIMQMNRKRWKEKYKSYIECEKALEQLPSVQPERKKGKWIYDGKQGRFPACKCSVCGHYENADWTISGSANYCTNCGADMRGDEE